MKKILAVIFSVIFVTVLFPLSAGAEKLNAPVLQYKIVNHDRVSLKWSKVEDAESYYIYKRDDKTGKYIKKFEVKSNKITLKNLSPDTEYSYSVAAVKGGEKSKSSNKVTFTTPVEWYLGEIEIEDDETNMTRIQMVRRHYDGSNEEPFKINGYGYIDDKVKLYIDDWIYFCQYTNPNAERDYTCGGYTEDDLLSLYRIKNDGTEAEEIFPLKLYYSYNMFIKHYEDYVVFAVNQHDGHEIYKSGLYIYSINDNKVTPVIESLNMNIENIDCYNGCLYFRKDNLKWHTYFDDENLWDPYYYQYTVTSSKNCSVNLDGTDFKEDDLFKNIYDEIGTPNGYNGYGVYGEHYYYYDNGISRINIKTGQKEKILETDSKYYLDEFEFAGDYIYVNSGERVVNEYGVIEWSEPCIYYCVKCDGTGLKKQNKPFEWRY